MFTMDEISDFLRWNQLEKFKVSILEKISKLDQTRATKNKKP